MYATFQDDVPGVRCRDLIGVDKMMWGSDYPHFDSTFPKSREAIARNFAGVPEEEQSRSSAATWSGLQPPGGSRLILRPRRLSLSHPGAQHVLRTANQVRKLNAGSSGGRGAPKNSRRCTRGRGECRAAVAPESQLIMGVAALAPEDTLGPRVGRWAVRTSLTELEARMAVKLPAIGPWPSSG